MDYDYQVTTINRVLESAYREIFIDIKQHFVIQVTILKSGK